MKIKSKSGWLAIGLAFLANASLYGADSIQLSNPYSSYLQYTWTSGTNTYNEPVSPYPAVVTYNNNLYSNAFLICLDINNPTNIGQTYTGTFDSNFSSFTVAEREASYLADKLYGKTNTDVSPTVAGPISLAIWSIMSASSSNQTSPFTSVPLDAPAAAWVSQATSAVTGGYVADNMIFRPTITSSQRFMVVPPSVIPEPSSCMLLGMGALGWVFMRRNRQV